MKKKKTISSLVSLVEEKAKDDPVSRRIWSTARVANQLAKTLRSLRHNRGQSEGELASEIGCSVDVIINLENPTSDNSPNLENMIAITQALGYELSIEINPIDSVTVDDKIAAGFSDNLLDAGRVLREYVSSHEANRSIAIVSVDSGGHVILPGTIEVEIDSEAFFHSIPMPVRADES